MSELKPCPQPSAEPVADWLQECTDGRVSSHTITILNAFRRWYDAYRVKPALEMARREALEEAAKVAEDDAIEVYPTDHANRRHLEVSRSIATAIRNLKDQAKIQENSRGDQ